MARTHTSACIAVEVFIEQEIITTMRVVLEGLVCAEYRTASIHSTQEDVGKYILRIDLGILDGDVEVAILCKNARVDQFIFKLAFTPAAIFGQQVSIWESALRILVKRLHIGMGRGTVKKVIVLLHVLTVIAFGSGQAEEPILENRVGLIPQAEREAQPTLFVTNTQQAIFAPAIRAGTSVIVGKRVPGRATRRIVLAHRSPLALTQVRSP